MTEEELEAQAAVVRPEPIRMKFSFPQGSVAIRPNLWYHWTEIAITAEARAIEARCGGLTAVKAEENWAVYSAAETPEAMIVVSAARSALTHLEADWRRNGYLDGVEKSVDVPLAVVAEPPDNVDEWLAEIKLLIDDRIRIAHEPQESATAEPHPAYPSNVSSIAAYYTLERATAAVDLLLDFYRRAIEKPTDRIREWSEARAHVPGAFDESRTAQGELS